MLYVDTSVFVSALTREVETSRMQSWLGERDADELFISDWVATEFSSALSIKLRTGQIDAQQRADALAAFRTITAESTMNLSITSDHFRIAARFADHQDTNLRAGDALHLAIASDHGATLCTLDRTLAQSGAPLGVKTSYLGSSR